MASEPAWGVRPDEKTVEAYFGKLALPVRVLARQLDALVREEIPSVAVGIKWGVPFYALRGPVCYVSGAKGHVTFGLLKGHHIDDDSGLLTGTGKSPIKKATFKAGSELPVEAVRAWLRAAGAADATWGGESIVG